MVLRRVDRNARAWRRLTSAQAPAEHRSKDRKQSQPQHQHQSIEILGVQTPAPGRLASMAGRHVSVRRLDRQHRSSSRQLGNDLLVAATGEPQCRPTPHFDNGTSMGHERFPALVAGWSPEQWTRYVAKGKQRISIHLNPFAFAKHHELLVHCFEKYPKTRKVANARLALLPADFRPMFTDMLKLICPEPFTPGRAMICSSLLTIRTQQLRALLE